MGLAGLAVSALAGLAPATAGAGLLDQVNYVKTDTGTLSAITQIVGAQTAWASGVTGKGVDVALIDTGVAPVPGLNSGQIVNGPDLSFDGGRVISSV